MTHNPIDFIVAASHQPPASPWNWDGAMRSLQLQTWKAFYIAQSECYIWLDLLFNDVTWYRLNLNDARSLRNDRWMSSLNRNPWPWDLCLHTSKLELPPLQVPGRWFWLLEKNQSLLISLELVSNTSRHTYPPLVVTLTKMFCLSGIHSRSHCLYLCQFLATHLWPGSFLYPPLDMPVCFT